MNTMLQTIYDLDGATKGRKFGYVIYLLVGKATHGMAIAAIWIAGSV